MSSSIYAAQDANQFPGMLAHTGTAGTADLVRVTADSYGNLGVSAYSPLVPAIYDTVIPTFGTTSDTWTFLTGGTAGGTVSVVTIVYSDSTKGTVSSIVKS